MDLLKGWIGPYVHQALTQALQWKILSSQSLHPVEDPRFEDDGSNLRVKCVKEGVVQFTKIEQVTSPIHVWISDSQAHVKVTISTPAAEHFKRAYRKQITQGTLGGIFQITNFEIVAQHHGPKKTKITMLIHELNHIGSDGSCAFGRPRPIECLEDIQELLDEFHAFRAKDAMSREASKDLALPKRFIALSSRTSSVSSLDTGEDLSQAAFATQAPHLHFKKHARAAADAKPDVGLTDTDRIDGEGDLGPRSPASLKGLISDMKPCEQIGDKPASGTDVESNTRNLVRSRCKANAVFTVGDSNGREDLGMQTVHPTSNDGLQEQKFDLLNLLAGKPKFRTLQVQIPAVKDGSLPEVAGSEKPAPPPEASVNASPLKQPQPQRAPSLPVTQSKDLEVKDFDVLDGNEITNVSRSIPKATSKKHPKRVTKPVGIRHRIGRKEVRIRKDQRDLLERPDAWLPPEPGYRAPTANLPISILEALNTSYDQKVDPQITSRKDEKQASPNLRDCSPEGVLEAAQEREEGSESDIPLSTSEWPPSSPQQPLLPPDSSVEAAEERANTENHVANRETETNINQATTFSRTSRRLSTASSSSASDMSGRRKLVRGLRPRRGSAQTDLSSSSESLLRRNPERNARSGDGTLTESTRADSPYTEDEAKKYQQDLEPNSVLSKPQQPDVTPEQLETSSLRSAKSSKSERGLSRSNPRSASMNFINSTQVSGEGEAYTDLPVNLDHRTEPRTDHFGSSGLFASDQESELETTLPHGLETSKDLLKKAYAPQYLPSTALQKTAPVIRVKQTPYVNGRPNGGSDQLDLPSKCTDTPLVDHPDGKLSLTAQLKTNILDISSAETNHDRVNRKETVVPRGGFNENSPVRPSPDNQSIEVSSINSIADHAISSIEETVLPMRPPEEAQVPSTLAVWSSRSITEYPQYTKRKAFEPLNISPNVTKRRKGLFTRAASDVGPDPAARGRQMRSEYLKSIGNGVVTEPGHKSSSNLSGGMVSKHLIQGHDARSLVTANEFMAGVEKSDHQADNMPLVLSGRDDVTTGSAENGAVQGISHASQAGTPKLESITTVPRATLKKTQSAPTTDIQHSLLMSGALPSQDADALGKATLRRDSPLRDQAIKLEKGLRQSACPDVECRTSPTVFCGSIQDPTSEALPRASAPQHVISEEKQSSKPPSHRTSSEAPKTANIAIQSSLQSEGSFPNLKESVCHPSLVDTAGQKLPNIEPIQQTESPALDQSQALPRKQRESESSKKPASLFARFKATYPDYPGNSSHFGKICNKIESLARVDRMEHPSLWDDFIIRHKIDYPQYTSQCMEDASDPMSYERFYRDAIEETKYTKRVVTPKTLHEVVPKSPSVSELGQAPLRESPSSGVHDKAGPLSMSEQVTQAWVDMPNRMNERRSDSIQDRNQQPQSTRTPPVISSNDRLVMKRKQSPDAVPGAIDLSPTHIKSEVVDLTEDDPEDSIPEPAKDISPPPPSAKRARRSLPWTASGKGESSTKIPKASPAKTVPASSPIPAPLRQPQSSHEQSIDKRPRPDDASYQKAPINASSPSMPPPVFKNPLTRYNSAKEPATPSTPAIKSPHVSHPQTTPKLSHSQTKGTPRQTQISGYWVQGRNPDDEAPYRIFERANKSARPGQKNAFAKHGGPTAKDAGGQSIPEGKSGKGWKHDPFSLFL